MSKILNTVGDVSHTQKPRTGPRAKRSVDLATLAGRLTQARLAVGLTQQQLADQCGVTRPVIVYIEKGRRKSIKTELLDAIASITGHRAEWIVHGTEPRRTSDDPLDAKVLEVAAQMTVDELRDSIFDLAMSLPAAERDILISDLEDASDA